MNDYVICKLCGNTYNQITTAHLRLWHKIDSVYDYMAMFPSERTISEGTEFRHSEALSEAMTGRVFSEDHLQSLSISHLELYSTPEGKALIESSRIKNTGKKVTQSTRDLLSQTTTMSWKDPRVRESRIQGLRATNGSLSSRNYFRQTSLESWKDPERHRKFSDMMREKWSDPDYKLVLRFLIHLVKEKQWEDPSFAEKMIIAWHKSPSGPELETEEILNYLRPGRFILNSKLSSKTLVGTKIPDFIGTEGRKEIVEVFGTYWHDPDLFPWRLNEEQLVDYYKNLGYTSLVVWEDQVNTTYLKEKLDETFPN
jgi:hypothetical protein